MVLDPTKEKSMRGDEPVQSHIADANSFQTVD